MESREEVKTIQIHLKCPLCLAKMIPCRKLGPVYSLGLGSTQSAQITSGYACPTCDKKVWTGTVYPRYEYISVKPDL